MIEIMQKKMDFLPEEVGYCPKQIDEINHHLCNLIRKKSIVSAGYILSKDGKKFACNAMGKLRMDSNDLFKCDSICRIASMTKVVTAISIMQLIEKGKIYLEQPVRTIIREFNRTVLEDVTIFHLLTHTSGLFPTPGALKEAYPREFDTNCYGEDWIKEGIRGNVYAVPGKSWAYSSYGYMLLSEIVYRITGTKYEKYVEKNIFNPLGLNNTFFYVPEKEEYRVSYTSKHAKMLFDAMIREKNQRNIIKGGPKGHSGIYSTLEDMQIICQMLLNGGTYNDIRILSRKMVETMTKNHLKNISSDCWNDNGEYIDYGLGVRLEKSNSILSRGSYGHEGTGLGGMFIDPIEKFILVYFCNLPIPIWIPEAVTCLKNIVWSGIV